MKTINDDNYLEILKTDFFAVLFSAPWCGHCKPMKEKMIGIDDFPIFICDVDESPEFSEKYNIMSIPTIIVYKDGEEFSRNIGKKSDDELKSILQR